MDNWYTVYYVSVCGEPKRKRKGQRELLAQGFQHAQSVVLAQLVAEGHRKVQIKGTHLKNPDGPGRFSLKDNI